MECFKWLVEVYGEETMSRTRHFKWHKRYDEQWEEVDNEQHSDHPSTSKTDQMTKLFEMTDDLVDEWLQI